MQLEYREFVGSLKDVDDAKHQVNVLFPHESPDTFRTVFLPDTFVECFARRKPIMCWQHVLAEPIGIATEAQSTRAGNELVGEFSDLAYVPRAAQAYSQIRDGHITDFSFGFNRTGPMKPWDRKRGILAFTRADMHEFSPVSIGSIPGAEVTGVRSDEGVTMDEPTREEILALHAAGLLEKGEARSLLRASMPEGQREHIFVSTGPAPVLGTSGGTRAVSDGGLLIQACDAALDQAVILFASVDTTNAEEPVRQAIALVNAASASVDEALEAYGLDDADDPDEGDERAAKIDEQPLHVCGGCGGSGEIFVGPKEEGTSNANGTPDKPETVIDQAIECPTCQGTGFIYDDGTPFPGTVDGPDGPTPHPRSAEVEAVRAVLTSSARNDLDDSDFAYIEPGGKKVDGKTFPRDKRHFPIPDAAHVRNALARIGQGAKFGSEAKAKVLAAAKKFGIKVGDDDRALPIEGFRKPLTEEARNNLPDSAFAYIEDGGHKDSAGRTKPDYKRHFPVNDADHARDALARIDQGAEFGTQARPKVLEACKKFGIKVSSHDHVSDDDHGRAAEVEERRAEAEAILLRRTGRPPSAA